MTLTFNQLRKIKDSLPDGTMHQIADDLGLSVETVRNYFGGANFRNGETVDLHIQPGPDGGLVTVEDENSILKRAKEILTESGVWGKILEPAE
jgi:transcriptional antiterminator